LILVESSVWVDYFNGRPTPEAKFLDGLLGNERIAIGDLILTEVLQGFRRDSDYRAARELLGALTIFDLLGKARALSAAENYRKLRKKGITIRKTSDVVIATYCIGEQLPLLFSDRDFQPFVDHLGLRSALPA
jgi:predicted nucleic acid-binding protein